MGTICLVLGTIGVFLPVLPTVPFYLATAFLYAGSSEKLHDWFVSTKLYKDNLESYVDKKGMTMPVKLRIICCVTVMMGYAFFMMARKQIWIPCMILAAVWLAHVVWFGFFVKTIEE
ncbi:MAG: YbaN family protein [Solobacterium sp.]|nr:YbaN family protein [Solobacterium sp.]